jgi:hypothetical protein
MLRVITLNVMAQHEQQFVFENEADLTIRFDENVLK